MDSTALALTVSTGEKYGSGKISRGTGRRVEGGGELHVEEKTEDASFSVYTISSTLISS
jgi:hypothetical protein